MPNNELGVTADFELRDGKRKWEVYSGQNGFVFSFVIR